MSKQAVNEVRTYIKDELPELFSAEEIEAMYYILLKDIELLKKAPGMNQKKMEMILHQKHKKFAFSYSRIFFSTVRGEMNDKMFRSLLQLKAKLDKKEISLDKAREGVIDGAKEEIVQNPKDSRPVKKVTPGSTTQELVFECKPDE